MIRNLIRGEYRLYSRTRMRERESANWERFSSRRLPKNTSGVQYFKRAG